MWCPGGGVCTSWICVTAAADWGPCLELLPAPLLARWSVEVGSEAEDTLRSKALANVRYKNMNLKLQS